MRMLDAPDSPLLAGMVTLVADDDAMFADSAAHYAHVGLSAARIIQRALAGRAAPTCILDLPCGHGRVTRVLRALYPDAAITVCDLDQSGVDFAAAHFGARGVTSQQDFRKLELGEVYDLIWVGSLITHLPEDQTRHFLDFAARHLSADGTLVVTSHGAYVAERLRAWNYGLSDDAARGVLADAAMDGYGYRHYAGGEGYGISLVSPRWLEALLADGSLQLDAYEPRGWDDHQDVLVLRRRAGVSAGAADSHDTYGRKATPSLPGAAQAERDAVCVMGFDEAWYLSSNPLVAQAVNDGVFISGYEHYRHYGWKEGRAFCDPGLTYAARQTSMSPGDAAESAPDAAMFDAEWYLAAYPDVRASLESGGFDSAWDHYRRFGRAEGRLACAADRLEQPIF